MSSSQPPSIIPQGGISMISAPGQPFHDPDADAALFGSLKRHLRSDIGLIEMPCAINDPAFAQACAEALLANLKAGTPSKKEP
jgi:uncharacterized protein (UPF0261 family)